MGATASTLTTTLGQRVSHKEHVAESPHAVKLSGLLVKLGVDGSSAQNFAVLAERKLHLFANEQAAMEWATPLAVWDLSNCTVTPYSAGIQSEAYPRGTMVLESPATPARAAVQNGATSVYLRAFDDAQEEEWLRCLQVATREPWEANADVPNCRLCGSEFDAINRRHHCRRCGRLVCDPCSPQRQALPLYGYAGEVRVCRRCNGENGPVLSSAAREAEVAEVARRAALLRMGARDSAAAAGAAAAMGGASRRDSNSRRDSQSRRDSADDTGGLTPLEARRAQRVKARIAQV